MARHISLSELETETFYADKIECHKQIWLDGMRWRRYMKKNRFANGISLICSPVEVVYTLPDGTHINAYEGDAVLLPRNCQYSVVFHGGGKDVDLYTVNYRLVDRLGTELIVGNEIEVIHGGTNQRTLNTAIDLFDAFLTERELKKQALLMQLLDLIATYSQRHSKDFYPIRQGVSLLMKEYNLNEKISRYAEESGISERKFYDAFKKWSGKTPVDWRNELRVNAAASLLAVTNLSISEIAFKTGFEDPYYFSRVFKKAMGVSPLNYRKESTSQGAGDF